MMMKRHNKGERGVSLLLFLGILAVISMLSLALYTEILSTALTAKRLERDVQALNLAEAGIEFTLYTLNYEDTGAKSILQQQLETGMFSVTIQQWADAAGTSLIVKSTGSVPPGKALYERTIEAVVAQKEGRFILIKKAVY